MGLEFRSVKLAGNATLRLRQKEREGKYIKRM